MGKRDDPSNADTDGFATARPFREEEQQPGQYLPGRSSLQVVSPVKDHSDAPRYDGSEVWHWRIRG